MGMFTEFQVNDGIVTLGNGGEQESIFPLSSIVAMDVDWMVASGRITFTLGADAGQRLVCHDLIVHHTGSGPGGHNIFTPKRARRHHSYLLVFTPKRARRPVENPHAG